MRCKVAMCGGRKGKRSSEEGRARRDINDEEGGSEAETGKGSATGDVAPWLEGDWTRFGLGSPAMLLTHSHGRTRANSTPRDAGSGVGSVPNQILVTGWYAP